jgi:hypothetical protein
VIKIPGGSYGLPDQSGNGDGSYASYRLLRVGSIGAACRPVRGWFRSADGSRNESIIVYVIMAGES